MCVCVCVCVCVCACVRACVCVCVRVCVLPLENQTFWMLGNIYQVVHFLKTFKCTENNGFFPYEWFDHTDKLDSRILPPYESFHSHLTKCEYFR